MENNPANVERNGQRNQANAQYDKKRHRFRAACNAHVM
jgi:hypothetical protein